jgi:hypothetical protein
MNGEPKAAEVDAVTVAGLALLLMPLLTTLHEIGGHAMACAALGGEVSQIGAFYVECNVEQSLAGRLVAAAGPAVDVVIAFLAYWAWRHARSGLARLVLWYVWLCCAFAAAGYLAYSGLTGIGDLNPGEGGGIGPLPQPWLFRILFAVGGAFAYWRLVVLGMRTLADMIGQGPGTRTARRTVAHVFYAVLCVTAVIASLPNPVGLFVTLASATAASFGGNAGLISIGFATRPGEARAFRLGRNWMLLAIGLATTAAFAIVLGPTITLAP